MTSGKSAASPPPEDPADPAVLVEREDVPGASTDRDIRRDAASIGIAVGVYGLSYGAVAVNSGLSVLQTCALSALAFTGASQFALVGVLGDGGAPMSGAATALLLGVRNGLYGVRLSGLLDYPRRQRPVAAQFVIDETTAMATAHADRRRARLAFVATAVAVFSMWNLATVVGATAAGAVGNPASLGLDAAFPAAFLALLWPRLVDRTTRAVALGGAAVALVATPFLPVGLPVLLAALVALVGIRG